MKLSVYPVRVIAEKLKLCGSVGSNWKVEWTKSICLAESLQIFLLILLWNRMHLLYLHALLEEASSSLDSFLARMYTVPYAILFESLEQGNRV